VAFCVRCRSRTLFAERVGFRCANFQKQRDNVLIGIRNIWPA